MSHRLSLSLSALHQAASQSLSLSCPPADRRATAANSYFRDLGHNYTTIPEFFRLQGYETVGGGKIFHPGHASGVNSTAARGAPSGACPRNNRGPCSDDQLFSWSQPYFHSADSAYTGPSSDNPDALSWKSVTPAEEAAHPLSDTQIADNAVKTLQEFHANGLSTPFFLACGFRTCHLRSYRSLLRRMKLTPTYIEMHVRTAPPHHRSPASAVRRSSCQV